MRDHRATAATVRGASAEVNDRGRADSRSAGAAGSEGARGRALREWLGNPLIVAVVSTLLVSLVIPQLTRHWQDHQKALEIQTGARLLDERVGQRRARLGRG